MQNISTKKKRKDIKREPLSLMAVTGESQAEGGMAAGGCMDVAAGVMVEGAVTTVEVAAAGTGLSSSSDRCAVQDKSILNKQK